MDGFLARLTPFDQCAERLAAALTSSFYVTPTDDHHPSVFFTPFFCWPIMRAWVGDGESGTTQRVIEK